MVRKCLLVFACFITSLILGIVVYSVSYIYPVLKETFNVSATVASGAVAICLGIGYFFGKFLYLFCLIYYHSCSLFELILSHIFGVT